MANTTTENFSKTYTTFSGCDIAACFNGKVIAELQGITYSISREKAPIYTLGSPEPRSFSRGKRGIAGTFVTTVFNRDALIAELEDKISNTTIQKFAANVNNSAYMSIDEWDKSMSNLVDGTVSNGTTGKTTEDLVAKTKPVYADEILPFDVTITFANEYGQRAVLVIYGVEILNEGSGFSIDSVTTEKAYTFVARRIDHMRSTNTSAEAIHASW